MVTGTASAATAAELWLMLRGGRRCFHKAMAHDDDDVEVDDHMSRNVMSRVFRRFSSAEFKVLRSTYQCDASIMQPTR